MVLPARSMPEPPDQLERLDRLVPAGGAGEAGAQRGAQVRNRGSDPLLLGGGRRGPAIVPGVEADVGAVVAIDPQLPQATLEGVRLVGGVGWVVGGAVAGSEADGGHGAGGRARRPRPRPDVGEAAGRRRDQMAAAAVFAAVTGHARGRVEALPHREIDHAARLGPDADRQIRTAARGLRRAEACTSSFRCRPARDRRCRRRGPGSRRCRPGRRRRAARGRAARRTAAGRAGRAWRRRRRCPRPP